MHHFRSRNPFLSKKNILRHLKSNKMPLTFDNIPFNTTYQRLRQVTMQRVPLVVLGGSMCLRIMMGMLMFNLVICGGTPELQ